MATGVSFTNTTEAKILNAVLRNTAFTPPASLYLALFTSAPNDAGGGVECSYAGYARQATTWGAPSIQSSGSQSAQTAILNFAAPAAAVNVAAIGLYDAATAGTLWGYLVYGTPVPVAAGQPIVVNGGDLNFLVD